MSRCRFFIARCQRNQRLARTQTAAAARLLQGRCDLQS